MDYLAIPVRGDKSRPYVAIYARYRSNNVNKKYALGLIVTAQEWLNYRQLRYRSNAVMTSIGMRYGQFAEILAQIKANFEFEFDTNKAQFIIRSLKAEILNDEGFEINETRGASGILLTEYLEEYFADLISGKRQKYQTTKRVSPSYCNSYRNLIQSIIKFQKYKKTKYTLDDVTKQFQQDYVKWLRDHKNLPNTINSKMARLRTALRIAFEEKKMTCTDFMRLDFVPKKQEVDQVYLSTKQIEEMINLDLSSLDSIIDLYQAIPEQKKSEDHFPDFTDIFAISLEQTRDIFIVGCLTGQRFSDYSRISKRMYTIINNKQFICLVQKKTEKKVYIPLDKRVDTILTKYHGILPQMPQDAFNKNLRCICELLQWTNTASIDKSRMGKKKGIRFCDMVTSHTARRSFATNAHAAGIKLSSIMAVTGHTTEKSFRRYLQLEDEEKALIAARDFQLLIKQ